MKVREQNARLVEALSRTVRAIRGVSDLPTLLAHIMEESKGLLECEASSLFLYDPERDELFFEIVTGGMNEAARQIRIPRDRGIVGAAATERESQIVADCASDARHFAKVDEAAKFVTRNLIATPMERGGRLIGVLEVLNKTEGTFDETDAQLLEIMAEHAAAAIEEARLIQAQRESERLAALGTASAKLSHFIKNVIQNWDSSAQLIDMGLERQDLEIVEKMWGVMKRTSGKISNLVQDMLTVSKEREPEREPVDLNALIEEILDECRDKAGEADIELAAEPGAAMPAGAMLDLKWMHDSILNLTGNAIDALRDSRASEGRVAVATDFDAEAGRITIRVSDNGPGVPADKLQKIFEPFFSTKGSRGSGLGLAVVKKYMEEQGGSIRVESEEGAGAEFVIELPYEAPGTA